MNFNKFQQVSIGILLFIFVPFVGRAATLYFLPQSQIVYRGESFIVELQLDTEGEEINAVGAVLEFPHNLLEITDFSKGGSILSLWPEEPAFRQGEISFVGGIPKGFRGKGLISKITFLSKEIGEAEVNFNESSKVLLNDGLGTEAELDLLEGSYEIIEKPKELPKITSRSHPDQDKWFSNNNLHLHWDLIEGAEYSFLLSHDPLADPDDIPDEPSGELVWMGDMEYKDLEDGIYYFHLKQKLLGGDWSRKVSFRAMVDVTIPKEFEVKIGQDPTMYEGKYFVSFSTTDETSGIDHYEILETRGKGQVEWKIAESPCVLEDQSLQSIIRIKAIDKAGNERTSEISPPKKPFPYWKALAIFVISAIIIWIARRFISRKRPKEKYEKD